MWHGPWSSMERLILRDMRTLSWPAWSRYTVVLNRRLIPYKHSLSDVVAAGHAELTQPDGPGPGVTGFRQVASAIGRVPDTRPSWVTSRRSLRLAACSTFFPPCTRQRWLWSVSTDRPVGAMVPMMRPGPT